MRTAQEFYAKSDPENVARLRMKLIQAGYMDPRAVGTFFLIRFGGFVGFALAAFLADHWRGERSVAAITRWAFIIMAGGAGYFLPGLVLMQLIRTKMREYRNGFPDFMDLMIVCSDAGMSMEAGIERVSKELNADLSVAQPEPAAGFAGIEGRAQPRRCAEIARRPAEPRRGALVRDAAAAVQGTRHQPVRRAAGVFGRNAPQAHVAGRGEGAFVAGQDVGAGHRLHPAGRADDRHHSDHREDDRSQLAPAAAVHETS